MLVFVFVLLHTIVFVYVRLRRFAFGSVNFRLLVLNNVFFVPFHLIAFGTFEYSFNFVFFLRSIVIGCHWLRILVFESVWVRSVVFNFVLLYSATFRFIWSRVIAIIAFDFVDDVRIQTDFSYFFI